IMWYGAIYLSLQGYSLWAFLLVDVEVIVHCLLCMVFIGWDSGFQYYLLIMPMAVFLSNFDVTFKSVVAGIHCFAFVMLNHYFQAATPFYSLNPIILHVLKYGNIILLCFIMAYFSYIYTRTTKEAEEKLEEEHQRANSALIERNKALLRLNAELAEAAEYVRTMLPNPIDKGYIRTDWRFVPSASLGGDAFGYFWVDDHNFAIYLLDVSGHGVGAALLSVSVMNAFRSKSLLNTDFKDPEQVLSSLNMTFPSEENNDMFFTIWYGVYNKDTRELTYASGGHPPAILLSDTIVDGHGIVQLRTPNYIIGGLSEITFEKQICKIDENSTLYIFSDGVYEVEKPDGTMWRLKEFFDFFNQEKATSLSRLDHLYSYVKQLGSTEHLEDDFTIIEVVFT
ncbi:PP2C family protein-serine/threonine phosphatase, partial [Thermodesulfobacteriota bacterium]